MKTTAVRQSARKLWEACRSDFRWHAMPARGSECNRLEYPPPGTDSFRAHLAVVTCAQPLLEQSQPGDTIYLNAESSLSSTSGRSYFCTIRWTCSPISVDKVYSYANVGLVNAVVLDTSTHAHAAGTTLGKVKHMVWEEYRSRFGWTLPLAEQLGYLCGSGPLIAPTGLRGHTVRMPMTQTTPWDHVPRDLYYMASQGETEFSAGGKVWQLLPYDLLLMPAGTPYQYRNNKLAETSLHSIGGKLPPGKKDTYFTEGLGWPIRANAPTFRVELAPTATRARS